MSADGNRWKMTNLGLQMWESGRDGRRIRATSRRRQQASRQEDNEVNTRERHKEGVGLQKARRTLWMHSGASRCTRRQK